MSRDVQIARLNMPRTRAYRHSMDEPRLFRKRYRIDSARLDGWDYGFPAAYFITMCTKWRTPWFGMIKNQQMELSDAGRIADQCWRGIPAHFPHVVLDTYVIMPDHVHGIVRIGEWHGDVDGGGAIVEINTQTDGAVVQTCDHMNDDTGDVKTTDGKTIVVETPHGGSLPWKSGCLGAIVNQFKSATSKYIHRSGSIDFAWQPRFHDHIVRNPTELDRIRRYIRNNPFVAGHHD